MGYRWEIEEAEDGAAGDAPAVRRLRGARPAAPGGQGAADRPIESGRMRDLRRLLLLIILVTGLSSASYLGWRYWQGRQLRARITEDVAAALRLEERALAEGDRELYLSQQSPARLDRLRRAPGKADQRYTRRPPQPGLSIAETGEVLRIRPEPGESTGGAIRSSSVELRFAVSDSLGSASFLERRHYRLDEAGRWIHDLPPEREREDEPLRWQGDYLDARYLPADADLLEPLFDRAEALLADFCAVAALCDRPRWSARSRRPGNREDGAIRVRPARLSFTGRDPGLGSPMRDEGLRYLRLPAPALTSRPADSLAEDLLLRHILRMVILSYADAASGGRYIDSYGLPEEGHLNHASLMSLLVDAWIAESSDLTLPVPDRPVIAAPPGSEEKPLSGLWTRGLGDWQEPGRAAGISDPDSLRILLGDFAAHLVEEGDAEAIARSISALPGATDARLWMRAGFDDRGNEVLSGWKAPFASFPADRSLLLECWLASGYQSVLYRPGLTEGLDLQRVPCPDGYASPPSWRPGGGGLSLLCTEDLDSADAALAGDGPRSRVVYASWTGLEEPDLRSIDAGGRAKPLAPVWTADGRWMAWAVRDPESDDPRLVLLPVGAPGDRDGALQVWPDALRPTPDRGLHQLRRLAEPEGSMHLALDKPLAAAPVGAGLLVEVEGESVASLDLSGAEPRERWRVPGSGPVWSPDGQRVALLRLEDDEPVLAVLDAASGQLLERARSGLPALLGEMEARAAREAPAASNPEDEVTATVYTEVRLRVGAWSPDGRWASLIGSVSLLSDWGPSYEASQWTLLDTQGSASRHHRIDGFVPLGNDVELPRWVSEGEAWLIRNPPGGSTGLPPIERLRVTSDRPAWDAIDPENESAWERLTSLTELVPDPRFELRTQHARSPSEGPWTALVERDTDEIRWRLEGTYCAGASWEPIRTRRDEAGSG